MKLHCLLQIWILRETFRRNYNAWLKKYGRVFAKNKNYRTSNIPIPIIELMEEMKLTMQQDFTGAVFEGDMLKEKP